MNATPIDLMLRKLYEATGYEAKQNGNGWSARCPAHDDKRPSLTISEGDDGRALLDCKAGCTPQGVVAAVGLTMQDLFSANLSTSTQPSQTQGNRQCRRQTKEKPTEKTYQSAKAATEALEQTHGKRSDDWTYHDGDGNPAGVIVRWDKADGKEIRPVARRGNNWVIGGMLEPRPLYCLHELADADRVFICEGEKAAEALKSIGLVATTSAHGSQSPNKTDWSPLAGKRIIITPDNDEAGRKYAEQVSDLLFKLIPCPTIRVLELPDVPDKGDAADWVEQRDAHDSEELKSTIEQLAESAKVIRAPLKERDRARNAFHLTPASELGGGEKVDWLWEGYVARAAVMLLVGIWKGGKTTLIAHFLKATCFGGKLVGRVFPLKVIVIAEENAGHWARRRDEHGIADNVQFNIRPFKCRPSQKDWEEYIKDVAAVVKSENYDLVIIDTWQSINPCHDENDASSTMSALLPLHNITEQNAAVILVHHPRKGDAGEGQAARGSGALPSFVDVIVELRRFKAEDKNDRRRKLHAYSRYDETPAEVVIELTDDGYQTIGTTADASRDDRQQVIGEVLSDQEWLSPQEIGELWPEDTIPKPGKRTLQQDLKSGYESGRWDRTGQGAKGDPYKYKFDSRTPHPLETGIE